jgi:hypothetical protein
MVKEMIEPREVTIGCWVTIVTEDGKRFITRVREIGSYVRVDWDDGMCKYQFDMIEPVPLSDMILRKHFPEYEEGYTIGWWDNPEDRSFQIEFFDDGHELVFKNVKYVHQLQMILSVIGMDKEISL